MFHHKLPLTIRISRLIKHDQDNAILLLIQHQRGQTGSQRDTNSSRPLITRLSELFFNLLSVTIRFFTPKDLK